MTALCQTVVPPRRPAWLYGPGRAVPMLGGEWGLNGVPVDSRSLVGERPPLVCLAFVSTACYSRHCFVWLGASARPRPTASVASRRSGISSAAEKVVIPTTWPPSSRRPPQSPTSRRPSWSTPSHGLLIDPARVRRRQESQRDGGPPPGDVREHRGRAASRQSLKHSLAAPPGHRASRGLDEGRGIPADVRGTTSQSLAASRP